MSERERKDLFLQAMAQLAPTVININNGSPFLQESRLQDVSEGLASIAIAVVNAAELYEDELTEKEGEL